VVISRIFSGKRDLGIDATPVDFLVTGGQVNDCTQAVALLGERKAEWVLADKGYDSQASLSHRSYGSRRGDAFQIQPQATAQPRQRPLSTAQSN